MTPLNLNFFLFMCMQIQSGKLCTFAPLNHFGAWNGRGSFNQEEKTVDFIEFSNGLEWWYRKLSQILGGSDHTLLAKLTVTQERNVNIQNEAGPIRMTFPISMYNASNLQVKNLQIVKKSYNRHGWVRYANLANIFRT